MMPEAHHKELSELLGALCEDAITDEQFARLEELLRSDPIAQACYVDYLMLCGELKHRGSSAAEEQMVSTKQVSQRALTSKPNRSVGWSKILGSVAAVLLLVTSVYWFFLYPQDEGVATLGYAESATWDGYTPVLEQTLSVGSYQLKTGLIRLTMANDSAVTLEGPSHFTLVNHETVLLNSGKLSARISDPNSRFTVLTDRLHVLDLGTAFGVNVDDNGQSLVSVFEGKVQVSSRQTSSNQAEPLMLHKGGVVQTDPNGTSSLTTIASDAGLFDALWPLTSGVEEMTHLIRYLPPVPNKPLQDYRSDRCIFMMPEQQSVLLAEELQVDMLAGKEMTRRRPFPRIPTGTRLSSYILFFNTQERAYGVQHNISGRITFDRSILGVATMDNRLRRADAIVGIADLDYTIPGRRGLEIDVSGPLDMRLPRDVIHISTDRKQLYFNLNLYDGIDQFRVFVAAD